MLSVSTITATRVAITAINALIAVPGSGVPIGTPQLGTATGVVRTAIGARIAAITTLVAVLNW